MNRKLRIIIKTIFGVLVCWGLIITPFVFLIVLADSENKLNVSAIVDTLNFMLKYWYIFGCIFAVLIIIMSAFMAVFIVNDLIKEERNANANESE